MTTKTKKVSKSASLDLRYAVKSLRTREMKSDETTKLHRFDSIHMDRKLLKDGAKATIFAVADGKGEYLKEAAAAASITVVEECKHFFDNHDFPDRNRMNDELLELFQAANKALYKREEKEAVEIGSTLTAAICIENTFYVGHVGNCRIYHMSGDDFKQVTVDQSLIIHPLDTAGGIVGTRRVITRQLGGKELTPPSYYRIDPEPGDIILMCSDGLTSVIPDENIAEMLTAGREPDKICEQLIDHARLKGADDDVTVISIKIIGSKGKKGKLEVPILSEKVSHTLFTAIPVIILTLVLCMLFNQYFQNREPAGTKGEPRFTLYSDVLINSFRHNTSDKTKYLKDNKGYIKLQNAVNRFDLEPVDLYSIELRCDKALDVNIDYGNENIVNIDSNFIGITVTENSKVTVKRPKSRDNAENYTVVTVKNLKGNLQANLLVRTNTSLKIK